MNDKLQNGPLVGSGFLLDASGERLTLTHGEGPYVFTDKGSRLTDFILGVGPVIIGHSNSRFVQDTTTLVGAGLNLPSYSKLHFDYADMLMDGASGEHTVVLFAKGASEAVAFALRLIAIETGKMGIIRCGYLGQADIAIGNSIKWHEPLNSKLRNSRKLEFGCRGFTDTEPVFDWIDLDLNSLEELVRTEGENIGAMAIDAHQFAFIGEEKLDEILNICERGGIMLVMDETKTAGRTGPRGYFDSYADRIAYFVLGKAIGNGGPIAVLTGSAERIDLYRSAKIGATHSKEIFGAACGISKLRIMEELDGYSVIKSNTRKVVDAINASVNALEISDLLFAESYFDDSIFELHFGEKILGNQKKRDEVNRQLQAQNILIMEGHCSFVCVDHQELDFDELSSGLVAGLRRIDFAC